MSFALNESDIASFNKDGVVALRGVIHSKDLDKLTAAIEDDIASPGPFYHGYESDEGQFHGNLRLWETHKSFADICLNFNDRSGCCNCRQ